MRQWIRFFIGTPQRFLATLSVLAILYGMHNPQEMETSVSNLLDGLARAIHPFVLPTLGLMAALVGLGVLVRLAWRGGGGRQ